MQGGVPAPLPSQVLGEEEEKEEDEEKAEAEEGEGAPPSLPPSPVQGGVPAPVAQVAQEG